MTRLLAVLVAFATVFTGSSFFAAPDAQAHYRSYAHSHGFSYRRPGFSIYIGPGYQRKRVYRKRHKRYRSYGYPAAHARYCSRKFKSWNPRTNRYLSYGGKYRRCRSRWYR